MIELAERRLRSRSLAIMDVSFHRGEGRSYFALARRDDGVLVRLDGGSYDRSDPPLPHDLAHFLVEDELGLRAGVLGVIAAGGLFPQATVVSGRQRPHARRRAREVIKRAGNRLTQAEVLVGVLCAVARAGEEKQPTVLHQVPTRWRPEGLGACAVERACERLREAAGRWDALSEGASLELALRGAPDASLADPPRAARRPRGPGWRSRR